MLKNNEKEKRKTKRALDKGKALVNLDKQYQTFSILFFFYGSFFPSIDKVFKTNEDIFTILMCL
jgi:hypothetical protein